MSVPRVIFINRFYWPDEPATAQLLTDLAEGLARSGVSTTVIARRPSSASPLKELRDGVTVERVPTSRWGRRSLAGRVIDFGTFLRGTRRRLGSLLQPGDIVVTLTDPPMLGPALRTVIRSRGAKWIHWIQDIFPEVASAVSGQHFSDSLIPWRNRAWREADHCVVPGADMAAFVHRQGVARERLTISPNWSPAGLAPVDASAWRERGGCSGKFIVMYSGNLGRVHDFSAIVPLARELETNNDIVLVFVGEGARRVELEADVCAANLKHFRFFPAQPRGSLAQTLSAGDLHLITLRAGCESLVFPSKLYGIAAVGRPALVLAAAGAEPARVASAAGFGAGFAHDDVAGMANYVRSLHSDAALRTRTSQAALRFSNHQGQVTRALAEWRGVLEPLIRLAAPRGGSSISSPTP